MSAGPHTTGARIHVLGDDLFVLHPASAGPLRMSEQEAARALLAHADLLAACREALLFLGQRTSRAAQPHTLEDVLDWCGGPALAARLRGALLKAEAAVPPT